jgi:hypothetical protein
VPAVSAITGTTVASISGNAVFLGGDRLAVAVRGDGSREHVAVRRVHDGKTLARYPLPALDSSTFTELWTVGDVLVVQRIDGVIQRVVIPTAEAAASGQDTVA